MDPPSPVRPVMMNRNNISSIVSCALAFALSACSGGDEPAANAQPGEETCTGKCDSVEGSAFFASLEGRDEPVADFLALNAGADGTLEGDYQTILDGVAEQYGCDPETIKTFVILLSNRNHFPRNIVTICSDSPSRASRFFLSTQSDEGELGDIDGRNVKIAAWDSDADKYNLYEIKPEYEGGPMVVSVEPDKCVTCHATPSTLAVPGEVFAPIMNELTNPWTLWSAEPDFRSHRFDEFLADGVKDAPVYSSMTEGDKLGSASQLETIMRSAFDRVAKGRIDLRREPASLTSSLRMLQPLFCDESVNYASENHSTNQVQSNILVDSSISSMLLELGGYTWEEDFIYEDRFRFADLSAGGEYIEVMPVRGDLSVSMDKRLVSRRVLDAESVLRLRALDWHKPVFSEFRCGLFQAAAARMKSSPPDLSEYETNADYVPGLFEEIMTLDGQTPLLPSEPGRLLVVPDASAPEVREALAAGAFGEFERGYDLFALDVEAYLESFKGEDGRQLLEAERNRRGCAARATFPSAPQMPNLSCD